MSDYVSGRKKLDVGTKQRSSRETTSSSSDMSVYKSSAEGSVRVKGSKESSVYKSSDELFEYSCDPCSSAGDHFEAQGFCTNCGEYLCGTCFRCHSRGKATKHHKLLNKDKMPRKTVQTCNPCKTVCEEIDAVGYCYDCEEYLCRSCFRSHSRSKATKHHNLRDKDSIAAFDINKEDSRYQKSKEEYSYVKDINVKAAGEARDCYIIAMALVSNNELVLADYNNVSLKHVDIVRNVIMGTLDLESQPYGLKAVSNDKVAVPLRNIYVIQIVTISGTLSVQRNIKLLSLCLDIEYLNGKFYASFEKPVNFQMFQPSGALCKSIKPDAEILKHCQKPSYIAVSPNGSLIYVSDWKTKKVLCIDINGNMISLYQNELKHPVDIITDPFGLVYLCDRDQHVVYRMTTVLSEVTVILGPGDGLICPYTMCYSAEKRHMYISSGNSQAKDRNCIKVFKW